MATARRGIDKKAKHTKVLCAFFIPENKEPEENKMGRKWLERTETLLGKEKTEKLSQKTVAILGLGGVGGAAAEAVCRMGIRKIILIDSDTVDITNLNRQLFATTETVGQSQCLAAKNRLLSINPEAEIVYCEQFFLPENSDFLFEQQPDLILDAIDTVTAKLFLAEQCAKRNIPLITCLGTGNRLDPSLLRWGDISETVGCGCPLARVMRRELKKRGVAKQTVIYSNELPAKSICIGTGENGRHSPASCAFVPPAAGYLMAILV